VRAHQRSTRTRSSSAMAATAFGVSATASRKFIASPPVTAGRLEPPSMTE
jgi:hypothetical protein